ncbi:CTDNEP1 [Mytilus coruscus]|uniref:Mitochondrial import inner membrane translocase subunit TIM50 n=1 Tax=Mytilus coruscus TaxID=42192 RepID=A0A6J8AUS9_MYTCO|nr:CTDNEP1 [Mytilus coruscus]
MTKKCYVSLKRFCISKLKGGRFKVGQPGYIGRKRNYSKDHKRVKRAEYIIQHQTVKYECIPLSPLSKHRLSMLKRKILVLDLDETLIHSHHDGVLRQTVKPGTPPDFVLKNLIQKVQLILQSYLPVVLDVVSQWYDLVHCQLMQGSYTKQLTEICKDLSSIFILENSPVAYKIYPDNAIPIKSWFSEPTDISLLCLLPMLDALRFCHDVRSVLSRNLHLHKTV